MRVYSIYSIITCGLRSLRQSALEGQHAPEWHTAEAVQVVEDLWTQVQHTYNDAMSDGHIDVIEEVPALLKRYQLCVCCGVS